MEKTHNLEAESSNPNWSVLKIKELQINCNSFYFISEGLLNGV